MGLPKRLAGLIGAYCWTTAGLLQRLSKLFEARLGLFGAVWDQLVVAVALDTSYLVYVLPTRVLGAEFEMSYPEKCSKIGPR